MKTVCKVAIGVVIALVLLIGGCTAIVGVGVNEVSKEADKYAITPEQWKTVKQGMTKKQVEKAIGEPNPDQQQEFESQLPESLGGETTSLDCWYYAKPGQLGMPSYQVCFTNGRVDTRSKF